MIPLKLKILLLWALFWASEIQPGHTQQNVTLSSMELCLTSRGTKANSIFYSKYKNKEIYEKLNFQWNTRFGEIQPFAIFTPNSPADISNAIICAKQLDIRVVARSGGHSYEKYSAGDNMTVVIDLIKMNQISVDKVSKTAQAGGGAILAHLYSAIWRNGNFGMPAGSCICLGAAHPMGGGFGYLSKRFGMTLDNILELEFVDANGDVRVANSTTNKDLFWALRGAGGGNFGIVTRIKYQLYDLNDVVFTKISLHYANLSIVSDVFHAWDSWNAAHQNGTAYTRLEVTPRGLSVSIIDSELTEIEIQDIKRHFPIGPETTVKSRNFIEVVAEESFPKVEPDQLPYVRREDNPKYPYSAKSYFSSKTSNPYEVNLLAKVLARVPEQVFVQFSSYGGAINRVPADATAFVHRSSLYMVQVGINLVESQELTSWVQEFDATALKVIDNGESYQNYIDGTLENYLERYYSTNWPRLLSIKRSEDPSNFFRFPQSIPVVWTKADDENHI